MSAAADARRSVAIAGAFTAAGLAVLVALGLWQMQRLAWKTDLIARVESRIGLQPVPLPAEAAWEGLDLEALDYTPVTLTGRFRHELESHVFIALTDSAGPLHGPGYWIVTPFALAAGGTVLVNRGFVPEPFRDAATRGAGQVEGEVTLDGILRRPERRGPFTPADQPADNLWFTRDPAAIGSARGIEVAPFYVDAAASATPAGGLPQAGETRVRFRNEHLQYALTWFSLAGVLVLVYVLWARRRLSS